MAARTIAGIWVAANGGWSSTSDPLPKNEKTKRSRALLHRNKGRQIFTDCPLERAALEKLARDEIVAHTKRNHTVRKFVEDHASAEVDHCIFVPLTREGTLAAVHINGMAISAARYSCTLRHGKPEDDDLLTRHLCGNGHLNCINPRHLAWGTTQQNSDDRKLHVDKPIRFAEIAQDTISAIKADRRLPNVVAVEYNVPAHIVGMIRRS